MPSAHPLPRPRGLGVLTLSTAPPEPAASRITSLRESLASVVGCSRLLLEQHHGTTEQRRLLSQLHAELRRLDRLAREVGQF